MSAFSQKVELKADLEIVKITKKHLLVEIRITNLDTISHTIMKPVVEGADFSLFKAYLTIVDIKRQYPYDLKQGFGKIETAHLTHEAYVTLRQHESFTKLLRLNLKDFTKTDILMYKNKTLQIFIDYGNIKFESDCIKNFYTGKLKTEEILIANSN